MPSYWLVDPDDLTVTVLELRDGIYQETAQATGDDPVDVARPYPVRLIAARLAD